MGERVNFLFVSKDFPSFCLAWKLKSLGHEIKASIEETTDIDIGSNMIERVDDWKAEIGWADYIIFDDIGWAKEATELRKRGIPVIGCSEYTDKLESDRAFGQIEMKAAGMEILPYQEFKNFQDAISFVLANPSSYVIKPCGKAEERKELCYVGTDETGNDVVQMLQRFERSFAGYLTEFQLQKKVTGIEVAVGRYFNGVDWCGPVSVNFEHKKMFSGDCGPNTGEMGTTMYWTEPNKLFNETLGKMTSKLIESGYRGNIDINCIVNESGVYPLEFTSRFGYPAVAIEIEGMNEPCDSFFMKLAEGESCNFTYKKEYQIGVVLAVPPFPFYDTKVFNQHAAGLPILLPEDQTGIYLGDVKTVNGELTLAGCSGYALIVCGSSIDMDNARRIAYNRVSKIIIPNMFYRDDIGEKWGWQTDQLNAWGWL